MQKIIIDGVNVAECGFYNDDIKSRSYPEFDCYIERSGGEYDYSCARCCDRPNCQYKQLKRLEAENKKLNKLLEEEGKIVQTKTGIIAILKQKNERLKERLENK